MRLIQSCFLLCSILVYSMPTFAKFPVGFEFNLTNSGLRSDQYKMEDGSSNIRTDLAEKNYENFIDKLRKNCPSCRFETFENRYGIDDTKVIFKNDWYIVVGTDPRVVEIQTKPDETENYRKIADELDEVVFMTARRAGLQPASDFMPNHANSHIHIGVKDNFETATEFYNFVTDLMTRSELAKGIGARDSGNAVTLDDYPDHMKRRALKALDKIAEDLRTGKINNSKWGIIEVAERIRNEVYIWHPHGWKPTGKYQAVNLNYIDNEKFEESRWTIEVRPMRAQSKVSDALIFTELLEKRLKLIRGYKKPVPVKLLGIPETTRDAVERFFTYVRETGVSTELFSDYLLKRADKETKTTVKEYHRATGTLRCKAIWF